MDVSVTKAETRYAFRLGDRAEDDIRDTPPFQRHTMFHQACQMIHDLEAPSIEPQGALSTEGVTMVEGVLPREQAAALSEMSGRRLRAHGPAGGADAPRWDDPDTATVHVPLGEEEKSVVAGHLDGILSPEITELLYGYYCCHFRIHATWIYRTHPMDEDVVSFLWHRDLAPMAQVHLMLYLTDGGSDHGGTDFLNLEQSRLAAEADYHFPNLENRCGDVNLIFRDTDTFPRVISPEPKAGDALLFAAPRILHRGRTPLKGFRDVLIMIFLPSTAPWQQDIADFGPEHLFTNARRDTLFCNPFHPLPKPDPGDSPRLESYERWASLGCLRPWELDD